MRRLRTVTVRVTPLLADIINQLVAERVPIDILARLDNRDHLVRRLQTWAPDLVLIGLAPNEGGDIVFSLRNAIPRARLIALSHDAGHGYLLGPHGGPTTLIDLSPEALIAAIRGF
jgi:hypothetical protein